MLHPLILKINSLYTIASFSAGGLENIMIRGVTKDLCYSKVSDTKDLLPLVGFLRGSRRQLCLVCAADDL